MKLNLADYDGVAFDFDGTLTNAYPVHEAARYRVFKDNGLGHISLEAHQLGHTYGVTTSAIIAGVLKATGELPPDADADTDPLVQKLVTQKRELYTQATAEGLDAQPGSVELVRELGSVFTDRLSIVTMAQPSEVMPFIKRYNLAEYFDEDRIISEPTILELGLKLKPAPDPYILAAKMLGTTDMARLLVIEDSPGGVASGNLAGATTLAVGTTNPRSHFYDSESIYVPNMFVAGFSEITIAA